MNVLFIYSEFYITSKGAPDPRKPLLYPWEKQFGISYISSLLKQNGHKTDLLALTRESKKRVVDDFVGKFRPQLICVTAVYREYDFILKISRYLKSRYPAIYLVIGGAHVTLNPTEALQGPFDAICIGEGEYPILELVTQLEKSKKPSGIRNLWIKHDRKVEKNSTRPFIENLDILPFPDRQMWQKWIKYPEKKQVILAGRGCPFKCTFCCNHALRTVAKGSYTRMRSPDNILKELKAVMRRYPKTESIGFEVESIDLNRRFVSELCLKLENMNRRRKRPLMFGTNLKIEPHKDYDDLFRKLKRANFKSISIGLESGSKRIRETVLRRYYSNRDILRAVRLAQKYQMKIRLNVMLGIPDEKLADVKKTFDCVKKIQPDQLQIAFFAPYPGTALFDLCKKRGLLKKNGDTKMERHELFLNMSESLRKKVDEELKFFLCEFYGEKVSGTDQTA
ncbi:MAG: radical SAM protein [Candidatus Omnitrophica bacterium]|nr:radical SAM protein [Candidatus Omnitrophota bacterium]MDD5670802.1 radical SAM protein [Candidatus Omnitrophota bacterium]